MERAFVDTSAWIALMSRDDPSRETVRRAIESFRGRLVTTNFILDETVTLALASESHKAAVKVGERLSSEDLADLIRLTAADETAAFELFKKRPDKGYSFTDCTSFAIMRRLDVRVAIALDDHFRQEGFTVLPPPGV